ncbi:cytochrome b/b6 domain-containing protein [Occallatibacter savannae]|uniref:cytochrome b/b6 domain-containing protein n=1 Tax=Occallatibacter savannae TaxID=1002691 RepID=UPI000D68FFD9|nr:cytochrome b/b6 domain-containing protein [Occallatibacter savannae]
MVFLLGSALPIRAQHKLKDEDCLTCHGDTSLTKDVNGKPVSLFVDGKRLQHSIHGSMKLACVDCHKDVKSLAHETAPRKISCSECHTGAADAYGHSMHAKVTQAGLPSANCLDCHGNAHEVLAGGHSDSPVNHAHIPATCGRCHGQKFLMESKGVSTQPFVSYQESVHGRAVENGSMKAAVCTDCHGSHAILPANDSKSPIYKFSVPATCGQCHTDIQNTFNVSIHGQAIARGNQLSPVCTDCHGIHSIKSHKDPSSPVAEQNLSRDTCARCHEGVRLSSEFGVPGNRVSTYLDSYHGLAAEGGSVVAANCSSCHGVHDILPSSDPRSTINRANLDATCGKCHKGVTQKFTLTPVHLADGVQHKDIGSKITHWVRIIYIILILGVIGGMFLHNFVVWRSKAVARRRMQNPMMQRMSTNQRWQHLVLLTSFIILVVTGFALKFPDSWFADLLGMSEHVRSIVHRVAGVVLIAAGFYHVFYIAIANEGRRLLYDITPGSRDLMDVFQAMRYHLGLGGAKPKFGRFTYGEKAEYWALVWGTALMGITGVMMWAKVWVGNLLARWWVDIATAIHFYEAILATLAIVVWHFYQVFGDPDVYPMNWAWWDGKMPVEQYRHEHELDANSLAKGESGTEPTK